MKRLLLRSMCAGMMLTGTAWAQSIDTPGLETPGVEGSLFVRGSYGHRFESDFEDLSGKFETNDARAEVGGTAAFANGVRWANFLSYAYNNYDSDGLDANVNNLSLASIVGWELNPCWQLMAGPIATFYAESGADWGDSAAYGGLVGATYSESDDWSVGLAVAATKRIEEGVGIMPIPMVRWNFAPQWKLFAGVTEVAARRGVGGYVGWSVAEGIELAAGAQFENRRFRLDDDGLTSDFIVEDKSVPIYARASWEMIQHLNLDVYAGAIVGGQLELNDPDDHFLGDDSYDATPLVGVRLRYEVAGL